MVIPCGCQSPVENKCLVRPLELNMTALIPNSVYSTPFELAVRHKGFLHPSKVSLVKPESSNRLMLLLISEQE